MADLDTAAADLLVHIKALDSEITRAQHDLAELDHALSDATSHLDHDWAAVEEHLQALLAKAHEEKAQLGQQSEAADHALGGLQTAVQGAHEEQHGAMQEGLHAATALAEHVQQITPHLEPLAQAVGEAAHGLTERAQQAEHALEQAFSQVRELLQDQLGHELEQMKQEVTEASSHLKELVSQQMEHVDQAFDDFEHKLGEVENLVAHAFEDARQHAFDVAEFSGQECEKEAHDQSEHLQTAFSALQAVLQSLQQEASEGAADVGQEGRHSLENGLRAVHAEAGKALDALGRMRDLLTRYSFVTM
ncbi:MAG TPA: hypothetical protein VEQ10_15580 [Vicinamibacteria bacterium]|nr:hypothetical protein [Vicinamibacteria bacterium]